VLIRVQIKHTTKFMHSVIIMALWLCHCFRICCLCDSQICFRSVHSFRIHHTSRHKNLFCLFFWKIVRLTWKIYRAFNKCFYISVPLIVLHIFTLRYIRSMKKYCLESRSGFGGLEVACWPLVTQVRGFAPGRSGRIFRAKKSSSMPSCGGEVNPSVPCRSFTACKIFLNVTWK